MTHSLIVGTIVRVVYPLLGLFALDLFLRGHNAPGGGFIAGLLAAAAVVLRYLALGRDRERENRDAPLNLITCGLALALSTAAAPLFWGLPFFTHTFGHLTLPLVGQVEWATAALFDLGVLLVVVGNVVTVIRAMTDPE